MVVALGLATLGLWTAKPPSLPPLPNPNGYDDFIKAAGAVAGQFGNPQTPSRDELSALVATNGEALRLLRAGLTKRAVFPTVSGITNFDALLSQFARMKSLALLLAADGRLHELNGQPYAAAQCYLDAIRFGNEMSRGGFLIHRLVGVALEAIGLRPLVQLLPKLNRDENGAILKELEQIEATRVTWEEVWAGETRFARFSTKALFRPFLKLFMWKQLETVRRNGETKHNSAVARLRLLEVELALRSYRADRRHAASRLEELTPGYLRKTLPDPFTGQPLIYRPQGTNWLLYSVGPDGIDDGGQPFGATAAGKGDLLLDTP